MECLPSCSIGRVRCVLMKSPDFLNTALIRGATDLVPCIARKHCCYKGRVCTSAARGRRPVYPVAERRVQGSCRLYFLWVVLSLSITTPVFKPFLYWVGNYYSKTVRFRFVFYPSYNA